MPVLEGIAAGIGMAIGCTGTWVRVTAMFSLRGLEASVWVKVGLGLGAASALALVIVLIGQQVGVPGRLAALLVWLGLLSGSYGAGFSIPFIVRVLTVPKTSVLGIEIRAEVGWALWLFAFSSVALVIAASLAAEQLIRENQLPKASGDLAKEARLYRSIAIATSAAIGLSWVVYYSGNWDSVPVGRGARTDVPTRTAEVGQPIQLGSLQLQVSRFWLQTALGGDPLKTHEPKGIWAIAEIEVTNLGDSKRQFDSTGQQLIVDGKIYSADPAVASDVQVSVSLNPGLSGSIVAVFDVPANIFPAHDAALDLRTDVDGQHIIAKIDSSPTIQAAVRSSAPSPPTVTETVTAPPITTIPTSIPSAPRIHTPTAIVGTCDEGGSCGVLQRAYPYNDAPKLYDKVLTDGATVFVVCQSTGDFRSSGGHGASNVWYQLDNGAYINSVYTPLVAEGIPQC
ncbi:MAG: DUF4352 domain-containing protein [Fimbriimonadaceae bacterium]|nr:DUF4352 domain-containing protein [Fimbriimonadaceae bacterium]